MKFQVLGKTQETDETPPVSVTESPAPIAEQPTKAKSGQPLVGNIIEHGAAPYDFDQEKNESYYVLLETADGSRSHVWGVDLPRALEEGNVRIGDHVELKNLGRQPVTVSIPVKDSQGNVVGQESQQVHRNAWSAIPAPIPEAEPPQEPTEVSATTLDDIKIPPMTPFNPTGAAAQVQPMKDRLDEKRAPQPAAGADHPVVAREVASLLELPFTALSSVGRLLIRGARSAVTLSQSAIETSRATVTPGRCKRIERGGAMVETAAQALMNTPEFLVFEDQVRQVSQARGIHTSEVIGKMGFEPEFSGIKEKMDQVWRAHPDKVAAYRAASMDFETLVDDLDKRLPGSDTQVREKVNVALSSVESKTSMLPGFGDSEGEYRKALAERIREVASSISKAFSALMQRFGVGRVRELTPS